VTSNRTTIIADRRSIVSFSPCVRRDSHMFWVDLGPRLLEVIKGLLPVTIGSLRWIAVIKVFDSILHLAPRAPDLWRPLRHAGCGPSIRWEVRRALEPWWVEVTRAFKPRNGPWVISTSCPGSNARPTSTISFMPVRVLISLMSASGNSARRSPNWAKPLTAGLCLISRWKAR